MNKNTRIRYTLIRKDTDKTFSDYIKTTIETFEKRGVKLIPAKHLPRKLKKLLKKYSSWEFEISNDTNLWDYTQFLFATRVKQIYFNQLVNKHYILITKNIGDEIILGYNDQVINHEAGNKRWKISSWEM